MAKERKIDIGHVLREMNRGNTQYFNEIMEDEERRKELSPFVLFHFIKGAQSHRAAHTVLTNDYANPYLFKLHNHPLLLLKLMVGANAGIGVGDRYRFVKPKTAQITSAERAVASYYECSLDEARDIIQLLDKKEIEQITESLK